MLNTNDPFHRESHSILMINALGEEIVLEIIHSKTPNCEADIHRREKIMVLTEKLLRNTLE